MQQQLFRGLMIVTVKEHQTQEKQRNQMLPTSITTKQNSMSRTNNLHFTRNDIGSVFIEDNLKVDRKQKGAKLENVSTFFENN